MKIGRKALACDASVFAWRHNHQEKTYFTFYSDTVSIFDLFIVSADDDATGLD